MFCFLMQLISFFTLLHPLGFLNPGQKLNIKIKVESLMEFMTFGLCNF